MRSLLFSFLFSLYILCLGYCTLSDGGSSSEQEEPQIVSVKIIPGENTNELSRPDSNTIIFSAGSEGLRFTNNKVFAVQNFNDSLNVQWDTLTSGPESGRMIPNYTVLKNLPNEEKLQNTVSQSTVLNKSLAIQVFSDSGTVLEGLPLFCYKHTSEPVGNPYYTKTDSNGIGVFYAIPPGDYLLQGGDRRVSFFMDIPNYQPENIHFKTVQISPTEMVMGKIQRQSEDPLQQVTAYLQGTKIEAEVDELGYFYFGLLPKKGRPKIGFRMLTQYMEVNVERSPPDSNFICKIPNQEYYIDTGLHFEVLNDKGTTHYLLHDVIEGECSPK